MFRRPTPCTYLGKFAKLFDLHYDKQVHNWTDEVIDNSVALFVRSWPLEDYPTRYPFTCDFIDRVLLAGI